MITKYYRNIPLLYLYSIFIKRISQPVIILYFLVNQLNFTQIGILTAVGSIVALSTEVHGGIFADLYGKKISLIMHSIFGILTMLLYFIGDSFVWFLLASVSFGLGGAFITGTRNALLYDTLKQLNKTTEFKKFNGRILLYSHLINALLLLATPYLYTLNTKLPFLISILFFLISLIIACLFIEPPIKYQASKSWRLYNSRFLQSLKEIRLSPKLLSAILMTVLTASFIFMGLKFIQPLLLIAGIEVIYFGVIYALMRAIMGLSGLLTHRLAKYFKPEKILFIGLALVVLSFFGLSLGAGLIIVVAILLLRFAEGFNRVILEDEVNKNINSDNRTTILSMSNLSQELFNAGLIFIFGMLADFMGIQKMFIYALGFFILCSLLTLTFIKIKKNPTT